MRKILLLFIVLMPFVLFSQSSIDKDGIKIALDTEISGSRVIATNKVQVSRNEQFPLEVRIMLMNTSKGKEYSIRFSCLCYNQLYMKKGRPVLLKKSNGKILTFKTDDDIDQDFGFMVEHDLYTNNIGFFVSRKQLNEIIQGKIVKVRLTTDDTKMIDFKIDNNLFSEVLDQQLKAIDDRMKNNDIYQDF